MAVRAKPCGEAPPCRRTGARHLDTYTGGYPWPRPAMYANPASPRQRPVTSALPLARARTHICTQIRAHFDRATCATPAAPHARPRPVKVHPVTSPRRSPHGNRPGREPAGRDRPGRRPSEGMPPRSVGGSGFRVRRGSRSPEGPCVRDPRVARSRMRNSDIPPGRIPESGRGAFSDPPANRHDVFGVGRGSLAGLSIRH